mmetsp:Transcript_139050/g.266693  ORF Transcript_139050/g.266693 Transcript_139050/m.266693 type:complete len:96 (-) Transcript_139050:64-351(-)
MGCRPKFPARRALQRSPVARAGGPVGDTLRRMLLHGMRSPHIALAGQSKHAAAEWRQAAMQRDDGIEAANCNGCAAEARGAAPELKVAEQQLFAG